MAATLSSTGTWTGLTFNTTKAGPTQANVPNIQNVDLAALRDANYPEAEQFVTMFMNAHGTNWQSASELCHHIFTNLRNREAPMVTTTRTYTP